VYLSACNQQTNVKQGVTLFAAVADAPVCRIPPNDDVNIIVRPSQKFFSDNNYVLQTLYNVPLSAASAVALNQ